MQTNKLIIAVLAAGFAGISATYGLSGPALAFDPNATPFEAFREGYIAYKSGDTKNALEGLGFAAEKGHVGSLWKLGQMYASGDGVAEDDRRAFEFFSRIVDDYADGNLRDRDSSYVARASVALGGYYHTGIAGAVLANEDRARGHFSRAAYFGDEDAQYMLAEMYLNGQGGEKNARQAARWFKLAADKGHAGAQAMLGRLMLEGTGVGRNTVIGLKWLSIALQNRQSDPDIRSLHEQAFAAASETERTTARAMAQDWIGRQN